MGTAGIFRRIRKPAEIEPPKPIQPPKPEPQQFQPTTRKHTSRPYIDEGVDEVVFPDTQAEVKYRQPDSIPDEVHTNEPSTNEPHTQPVAPEMYFPEAYSPARNQIPDVRSTIIKRVHIEKTLLPYVKPALSVVLGLGLLYFGIFNAGGFYEAGSRLSGDLARFFYVWQVANVMQIFGVLVLWESGKQIMRVRLGN